MDEKPQCSGTRGMTTVATWIAELGDTSNKVVRVKFHTYLFTAVPLRKVSNLDSGTAKETEAAWL